MLSEMVLKMPKTESDGGEGINSGDIETYKNSPMMSLSKEELQNSTDGAIRENGVAKKVRVEFSEFHLPTDQIPDIEKVKKVYREERDYWDDFLENDKKAVYFFDKAIAILNKDKIRCIRISDFNTTGLCGVKEGKSTPWKNLVKHKGISDKPKSATGSFGIGKAAAYACSELRIVFYNTVNTDPQDNEAFEGCLKLPSYSPADGIYYTGTGYFCESSDDIRTEPLMKNISLEPGYKRTETGMDKYIIGFSEDLSDEELKEQIISSSVNNFLLAFWNDQLEVVYGDTVIDKVHLDEIFANYDSVIDLLTKEYYETLKAPAKTVCLSLFEENDVNIQVRLDENASRRAAIVRQSGMRVFDKGNISGRIPFSAVVLLSGEKVNGYFKQLENPEHTGWALDRAANKREAQIKQGQIFASLKDAINELHQQDYATNMDADGVAEYLPMAYTEGKKKQIEGLNNTPKEKKKAAKKKHTKPATVKETESITYKEDEQGNIIEETITIEPPTHSGTGHPGGQHTGGGEIVPGAGGEEKSYTEEKEGSFIAKRVIPDSNFRFVLGNDGTNYHLRLKGEKSVKAGFIEIMVSGETEPVKMKISKAEVDGKEATVSGNKIKFNSLEGDILHEISFRFANAGNWAIEVSVYEN